MNPLKACRTVPCNNYCVSVTYISTGILFQVVRRAVKEKNVVL